MEKNLKIVTYNIHHGNKAEAIINNISSLASQGVSIFCLQEIRKFSQKKFLLDSILKILGKDWQSESLIKPNSNDLGLCFLWKSSEIQALEFKPILLPKLKKLYVYERAFEKIVSGYHIKKNYPRPVQRAALVGEFIFTGHKIRISNVHMDWAGGAKQRVLQVKYLLENLEVGLNTGAEIICGDFNTVGFYRFHKRRAKKINAILGNNFKDAAPKKPTTSYLQTLDHIFVKDLSVLKSEIIKYKGSDHFPLLAELSV